MRIFERSLRNLFKDLAKIFAKILQDLQGFYQDLAKILGEILTGSLLGSFKIHEDSIRIFEDPSQTHYLFMQLLPNQSTVFWSGGWV